MDASLVAVHYTTTLAQSMPLGGCLPHRLLREGRRCTAAQGVHYPRVKDSSKCQFSFVGWGARGCSSRPKSGNAAFAPVSSRANRICATTKVIKMMRAS